MIKREDLKIIAEEKLGNSRELAITDLDSYEMVELLMAIETEYSIVFETDELEELKSLEDLICLINEKLKQS